MSMKVKGLKFTGYYFIYQAKRTKKKTGQSTVGKKFKHFV